MTKTVQLDRHNEHPYQPSHYPSGCTKTPWALMIMTRCRTYFSLSLPAINHLSRNAALQSRRKLKMCIAGFKFPQSIDQFERTTDTRLPSAPEYQQKCRVGTLSSTDFSQTPRTHETPRIVSGIAQVPRIFND